MRPLCPRRQRLGRRSAVLLATALVVGAPAFASETMTYSYDTLGRLVKVARTGTVNAGASSCYAYDKAANRTNVTASTSSDCSGPIVSFSVADTSVTEGGALSFTVTKTGTATGSTSVSYATANGTAASGADYTIGSGTLTFLSTDTSKTVSVPTTNDTAVESNETALLNLSNAVGAIISDSQGVGTIIDNDTAPTCGGVTFSIATNGAVTEGATSSFTVTKSGPTSNSCSVNYATANGTAVAGSDYTAKSGTLAFTSAQTSQTVSVATTNDTTVESAETFTTSLSGPTGGATIGTATATATINDNDTVPNNPPNAVNNTGTVRACEVGTFNVTANDSDPDGDPISVVSVVGNGFSVASSTSVTYQNDGTTGTKVGTYTIQDSHGATDSATLTITVPSGQCP